MAKPNHSFLNRIYKKEWALPTTVTQGRLSLRPMSSLWLSLEDKWHREKNATTLTGHPQDSLTEVFCKARFVPTLVVSNPAIRPKCKDSTEHSCLVKTTETIQSHSHRRLVLPPLSPEEFIYNTHSPMVKTKTIELFPELYISLP